jgi:hypothetical protein
VSLAARAEPPIGLIGTVCPARALSATRLGSAFREAREAPETPESIMAAIVTMSTASGGGAGFVTVPRYPPDPKQLTRRHQNRAGSEIKCTPTHRKNTTQIIAYLKNEGSEMTHSLQGAV